LNFDKSVLLRTNSFTLGSIVISAWLSIKLRVDGVALTELHLISLSKSVELPTNEAIVEGVNLCGNKRSAPINIHAKVLKILHSLRWEKLEPVFRVLEFRNLRLSNSELYENLELSGALSSLTFCLSLLNFSSEATSGSMDWHTSAMESEGEENILSELALIADLELTLRH